MSSCKREKGHFVCSSSSGSSCMASWCGFEQNHHDMSWFFILTHVIRLCVGPACKSRLCWDVGLQAVFTGTFDTVTLISMRTLLNVQWASCSHDCWSHWWKNPHQSTPGAQQISGQPCELGLWFSLVRSCLWSFNFLNGTRAFVWKSVRKPFYGNVLQPRQNAAQCPVITWKHYW